MLHAAPERVKLIASSSTLPKHFENERKIIKSLSLYWAKQNGQKMLKVKVIHPRRLQAQTSLSNCTGYTESLYPVQSVKSQSPASEMKSVLAGVHRNRTGDRVLIRDEF